MLTNFTNLNKLINVNIPKIDNSDKKLLTKNSLLKIRKIFSCIIDKFEKNIEHQNNEESKIKKFNINKIDKDFADNLKARLSLTDLIDPISRITYIFESGKIELYLKEILKMISNKELNTKTFINIISDTNIPKIGSVSYFIKSLGVFMGAFKGIINGIAEINAGMNKENKFYKYLGIIDLIGSFAGFAIIFGAPLAGMLLSSILIPIKGTLIFKNSKNFSNIQKADYIFSSIGTFLNYSLYFKSILPYSLPFMFVLSVLQLMYMNNKKFRKYMDSISKVFLSLIKR